MHHASPPTVRAERVRNLLMKLNGIQAYRARWHASYGSEGAS